MKLKVAVVGAGAAGLCCARHLSRYKKYFQFRVLEQGKEVGGTWLYSELPSGECGNSVHSSMYKNLRYIIKRCLTGRKIPSIVSPILASSPGHRRPGDEHELGC